MELGPTVPFRHLLHLRQDHARSEEFRHIAALTVGQVQTVMFQAGLPKVHHQLQPLVPMEESLRIAAPMEAKAPTASYHLGLLLVQQPQQVALTAEFLRTAVQTEEVVPIVRFRHHQRHTRQLPDLVHLEEYHHTVVQMEELVQTVPCHHQLLPIRQPLDLVHSEEFHLIVAQMEDLDQTVSFQHKDQQHLGPAQPEEFHHIVVPMEELDRIATFQRHLYLHRHDHHRHHQLDHLRHPHLEATMNISHPVQMELKGQDVFCQSLHHRPDHQADQRSLHVRMEVSLHIAVPMEVKDPIVLSLQDLLQDQPLQLDVPMAEFLRSAVPMVEAVQIV